MADGITLTVNAKGTGKAARDIEKVGRSAKGAGKDFKTAGAGAAKMGSALKGPLVAGLAGFTIGAAAATAVMVAFQRAVSATNSETFELAEELDTITKNG